MQIKYSEFLFFLSQRILNPQRISALVFELRRNNKQNALFDSSNLEPQGHLGIK